MKTPKLKPCSKELTVNNVVWAVVDSMDETTVLAIFTEDEWAAEWAEGPGHLVIPVSLSNVNRRAGRGKK